MVKRTLVRWMTENRADTRRPGPPDGRRYAVPFARVWEELRAIIRSRRGWTLEHTDETNGLLTVTCRSLILRAVDDLAVWVSLDRQGFTCVEARSRARSGRGDLGVNRRRIERLLRELDRRVE